jgi:hypothetical protein
MQGSAEGTLQNAIVLSESGFLGATHGFAGYTKALQNARACIYLHKSDALIELRGDHHTRGISSDAADNGQLPPVRSRSLTTLLWGGAVIAQSLPETELP